MHRKGSKPKKKGSEASSSSGILSQKDPQKVKRRLLELGHVPAEDKEGGKRTSFCGTLPVVLGFVLRVHGLLGSLSTHYRRL